MQELFDRIKNYSDVCRELGEPQVNPIMFHRIPLRYRKKLIAYTKLQQIARLFNGDWEIDWNNTSQYKYYPYFEVSTGRGLVFFDSCYLCSSSDVVVAFFKNREISDFVGRAFIEIYIDLAS